MNFILKLISLSFLCLFLSGCGAYFSQPVEPIDARVGELTPKTKTLKTLPLPKKPIVVGVYNFKDQTGQYKQIENGSSFSTAVSQGATTMLVKALEDSRWFTPIERENLNNLLNERNIIRSTRDEYNRNEKNQGTINIPPLLYAGILLEGGIVSYDSNILTGGLGARYFGVGGSTQYRQDRITVYLRAVSTSNGEVLKTVYVSKTILSQAVDVSLFRYVNFQRLLEIETGYTKNEPVQLAMQDAIEKAVESLIIEGIGDDLWGTQEGDIKDKEIVEAYLKEKEFEESTLLYDRKQTPVKKLNSFQLSVNTNKFNSDFARKPLSFGASFGYTRQLTDRLGATLRASYFQLETGSTFKENFYSGDILVEFSILPYDQVNPYLYTGIGRMRHSDDTDNMTPLIENQTKLIGGAAISAKLSSSLNLHVFAETNYTFGDNLDRLEAGTVNDYFFNFGLGLRYSFGIKSSKNEEETTSEVENELLNKE